MTRRARILHHGRCFDGAVSAALLIRLLRRVTPADTFETVGQAHRPGSPYDERSFTATWNAVVDFRYSSDPALTWWFDHHASTFSCAEDRRHFESDRSGQKFFDPEAPSCAGLIHQVARSRLNLELTPSDPELIEWADTIDAARFPDASTAVGLRAPALQLMTWLEVAATEGDEARLIAELADAVAIPDLVSRTYVTAGLQPALDRHRQNIALVRSRMEIDGGVAFVDLMDAAPGAVSKFIPYDADPDVIYTVMVLRTKTSIKISVGSNPWAPERRQHDIAALCQRFGGGGHAAVGAISLDPHQDKKAYEIAFLIASILREQLP
ncbi:MAG: phosphoesterase [bacterium]